MINKSVRLNKFLANAGFLSRRKVEEFLKENEVTVNGVRIFEPGFRFNSEKDKVLVNDTQVKIPGEFVYFILNKPKGVITTASDEHGRKTVVDLVKTSKRIYPVGRLDADSKGLVLLTNDGELANRLIHPKYHIPKTYICLISGKVDEKKLKTLQNGVQLKSFKTSPADAKIIEQKPNRSVLQITLFEGKNRQIRKMCASVKLPLLELKRISIGPIKLGALTSGQYRPLTDTEVNELKESLSLT
jgi:23S rRNA pseudouridine2605 synthase